MHDFLQGQDSPFTAFSLGPGRKLCASSIFTAVMCLLSENWLGKTTTFELKVFIFCFSKSSQFSVLMKPFS